VIFLTLLGLDPPKSPLKRGTLNSDSPFLRGVRGDLQDLDIRPTTSQIVFKAPDRFNSASVAFPVQKSTVVISAINTSAKA
jgi:hypothetical protein